MLADVYKDADRAAQIIRRLRDMLKRETPGFSSVDLNHVIRTVERIVHSDAILHGVDVHLDLSPGQLRVTGDSIQLQQVVLNLMTNAFSAMSETERDERWLIVRTKSVDGSSVLMEAQDNGTGIAPDKLESIFDPFITSKCGRDGDGTFDLPLDHRTSRRIGLGGEQYPPRCDVFNQGADGQIARVGRIARRRSGPPRQPSTTPFVIASRMRTPRPRPTKNAPAPRGRCR